MPSWLSMNVTPLGSVPVSLMAAVGWPVVVTVKVPPRPLLNVALLGLVIAGATGGACTDIWYAGTHRVRGDAVRSDDRKHEHRSSRSVEFQTASRSADRARATSVHRPRARMSELGSRTR